MQHGAISLQGTSRSRNEDRYDVAVSVQCSSSSYIDTCISEIASCTCWSGPRCSRMHTSGSAPTGLRPQQPMH